MAGCGDDGSSGGAGTAGSGGSGGSEVTVTASDADSAQMDLIYDGSVTGYSDQIDPATSTIACPNAAPIGPRFFLPCALSQS